MSNKKRILEQFNNLERKLDRNKYLILQLKEFLLEDNKEIFPLTSNEKLLVGDSVKKIIAWIEDTQNECSKYKETEKETSFNALLFNLQRIQQKNFSNPLLQAEYNKLVAIEKKYSRDKLDLLSVATFTGFKEVIQNSIESCRAEPYKPYSITGYFEVQPLSYSLPYKRFSAVNIYALYQGLGITGLTVKLKNKEYYLEHGAYTVQGEEISFSSFSPYFCFTTRKLENQLIPYFVSMQKGLSKVSSTKSLKVFTIPYQNSIVHSEDEVIFHKHKQLLAGTYIYPVQLGLDVSKPYELEKIGNFTMSSKDFQHSVARDEKGKSRILLKSSDYPIALSYNQIGSKEKTVIFIITNKQASQALGLGQ